MRTPTLQPVPESLPADHVSNSNKKKVRKNEGSPEERNTL